jgi:ABC-type transport system involved in multi-copper enzyme maturation permease subunit
MTSADMDVPLHASHATTMQTAPRGLEAWMVRLGDLFNPILVKEARQALKSRQFVITFALLLACGWAWSFLGAAMIGPEIYQGAQGHWMFYGYYVILSFPLLVIVPFTAFRSLTAEREDGTLELVSLSTLSAGQIVAGKLGSAALQMMIYLSAITPCLAFTYLLRGIDLLSIVYIVFWLVACSLGLSVLALFLAGTTRHRHWQIVLSVVLVLGLGTMFVMGLVLVGETVAFSFRFFEFDDPDFWIVNALVLSLYACGVLVLFLCARAQLKFPSDNRSTDIRYAILLSQGVLLAWLLWGWLEHDANRASFLFGAMFSSLLLWWFFGAFLVGEAAQLSPRVRRQLPHTLLGRALRSWFQPGSGTGYVFAVASYAGVVLSIHFVLWAVELRWADPRSSFPDYWVALSWFGVVSLSYLTIFLGLGRLIVRGLGRVVEATVPMAFAIQVLLVLLAVCIPFVIGNLSSIRSYWWLDILNPFYTLASMIDDQMNFRGGMAFATVLPVIRIGVPLAAAGVFVANLPGILAELRQRPAPVPPAIAAEQPQPPARPEAGVYASPWDSDE